MMFRNQKNFRYEVIADNSGKWAGNGVTFDTFGEAVSGAVGLASRWTLVRDWRILQRDGDGWRVVSDPKTGKQIEPVQKYALPSFASNGCERKPKEDKPEPGKQYRLTGGPGTKSIANGDSWSDSEVQS